VPLAAQDQFSITTSNLFQKSQSVKLGHSLGFSLRFDFPVKLIQALRVIQNGRDGMPVVCKVTYPVGLGRFDDSGCDKTER
jgi:hypothetical protein